MTKTITVNQIAKAQNLYMKMFEIEYEDWVDRRALANVNRAYTKRIKDMIEDTTTTFEQVHQAIEKGSWVMNDLTFKPICDMMRSLGFDIKEGK